MLKIKTLTFILMRLNVFVQKGKLSVKIAGMNMIGIVAEPEPVPVRYFLAGAGVKVQLPAPALPYIL